MKIGFIALLLSKFFNNEINKIKSVKSNCKPVKCQLIGMFTYLFKDTSSKTKIKESFISINDILIHYTEAIKKTVEHTATRMIYRKNIEDPYLNNILYY